MDNIHEQQLKNYMKSKGELTIACMPFMFFEAL